MNTPKIVLASKSARRRELLEQIGVEFDVVSPETDEDAPDSMKPDELVQSLASRKLYSVLDRIGDDTLIISADTVVCCGGEIFGKPADCDDARRMLRAMSGRTHEVFTGLAVSYGGVLLVGYERTSVTFRRLSDGEIDRYIACSSVTDKAGAYGIQEKAALFVEKIDGDYFNIVGLPLCRLGEMLRRDFGIEL